MLTDFANWLQGIIEWAVNLLLAFLVEIFNQIILAFSTLLTWAINAFPSVDGVSLSPPQELIDLSGNLNWFLPIGTFSTCLAVICSAYLAYFGIRPLLKLCQLT